MGLISTQHLYKFHQELNKPFRNTRELLSHSLHLIAEFLKLDQVSFFVWDPLESILDLRLVWRGNVCMDGEEDIHISENSPLRIIFEGENIYTSKNFYYPAYYIGFNWQGYTNRIGLKFNPHQSIRTGVLRLAKFKKNWSFSAKEEQLLKLLCRELAHKMIFAELNEFHREQLERANILTELNTIFASSMRLDDGIKLIAKAIQKHFGFDRIRLYLINEKTKKLEGKLSADLRGKVEEISKEQISMHHSKHPFAEILSKADTNIVMDKNRNTVVYLPLMVKARKVGLLIVDNLLSQNPILHDDLVSLSSFAGQIAMAIDNATLFDKVQELSQYDELTQLAVRRYFMERFQEELYRAKRFNLPVALIWMDVDNFKPVNDNYGHKVGDEVLKGISKIIRANLRKIDLPCRYGGDEILILLPQAQIKSAHTTAKRLLAEIRKMKIPTNKTDFINVTVSQGVAVYPDNAKSLEGLMQAADDALYFVKTSGRNKVVLFSEVK
jgi:diguanylate cyclase (GGDEF)-like protein